jgi:cell division protein FtsN
MNIQLTVHSMKELFRLSKSFCKDLVYRRRQLSAETSGSIGIIIGVIVGVIIALVLALVFTRRRRHLNEKRRKNISLQVPNGQEAQLDEKETATRKAKAESADEMAAPVVPRPTGATKAPKLRLAVEEGFELQNTPPLVSSFLQMFSPKPEGVQNVAEGVQHV